MMIRVLVGLASIMALTVTAAFSKRSSQTLEMDEQDSAYLEHMQEAHSAFMEPMASSFDEIPTNSTINTERQSSGGPITVFYNYYVNRERQELAASIAKEQMDFIQKSEIYSDIKSIEYITIETPATLDCPKCNHYAHYDNGWETVTLQALYEHCGREENKDGSIIYIHDKGSYHDKPEEAKWRNWLMEGVFSESCRYMASECNACAIALQFGPHIHVHGNMFKARCSYIKELTPPQKLEEQMDAWIEKANRLGHFRAKECRNYLWKCGAGRYASEHWALSHPSLKMCIARGNNAHDFPTAVLPTRSQVQGRDADLKFQVDEWIEFYGKLPAKDSWLWSLFADQSLGNQLQEQHGTLLLEQERV